MVGGHTREHPSRIDVYSNGMNSAIKQNEFGTVAQPQNLLSVSSLVLGRGEYMIDTGQAHHSSAFEGDH